MPEYQFHLAVSKKRNADKGARLQLLVLRKAWRGLHVASTSETLNVRIADVDQLERYRFGTGTADFLICRRCGAVPVVASVIDDVCYAVVNVNTLENTDRVEFYHSSTDFEGEAKGDRLARRQRNWIPEVAIDATA